MGAIPGRSSRATRHYSGFRAQGRSYRGVRRRSGQRLIATGDTELLRIPTTMIAIERQKKAPHGATLFESRDAATRQVCLVTEPVSCC